MANQCSHCNGTGKCQLCRGTGRIGYPGFGSVKDYNKGCGPCLDSGVCPYCKGTGVERMKKVVRYV